jgi:endonuclease YncB( thermonuclease family)
VPVRRRCGELALAIAPQFVSIPLAVAVIAASPVPEAIPAQVVRVVDGDTIEVRASIWPGHEVRVLVRLHGIDAPELPGRCRAESDKAEAARQLVGRLTRGRAVTLYGVRHGKYAGRVVARVVAGRVTAGADDLGEALLAAGLARRYAGGERKGWCGGE